MCMHIKSMEQEDNGNKNNNNARERLVRIHVQNEPLTLFLGDPRALYYQSKFSFPIIMISSLIN